MAAAAFSVATLAVCIYALTFDGGCDTSFVGAGVAAAAVAAFTSVFVVAPAATLFSAFAAYLVATMVLLSGAILACYTLAYCALTSYFYSYFTPI